MAGYIGSGASVVSSGVENKKVFDITTNTTSLTGLNYTVGKVHVYHNGVRLVDGTDFTATNSTSIALTVAAVSGDQVVVVSFASYQVALSGIDDQSNATAITIDSSENVLANTTSTSVIGNGGFAIKPQTGNGTRVDISNDGEAMLLDGAASGPIIGLYGNGTTVGSIGAHSSGTYLGTADTGIYFNSGNDSIDPYNPSVPINRDNAISLGAGSRRFKDAYLSGGIYLGGTGAANKLDDYEEGTWTPSLGGNAVYSIQEGYYVKVGGIVYITMGIRASTLGTGSTLQITGLPFTAAYDAGISPSYYDGIATNIYTLLGNLQQTSITFYGKTSATTNASQTPAIFQNNARVYLSATYRTNS